MIDSAMKNPSSDAGFTAKLLHTSASAFAGYAAAEYIGDHPEVHERYGRSALTDWKLHLTQRVLDLSAALRAGEPQLFAARMRWERNGFVARGYPAEDLVTAIETLREVLEEELPESSRPLVRSYLETGLEALQDETPPESGLDPEHDRAALEYLLQILEGDPRAAIDGVLARSDEGVDPREIYTRIFLPTLREVGRMWHANELGIAEEHLVTDTTRRAMAAISLRADRAEPNGKTIVIATVSGNAHELGPRFLADYFELSGWRTVALGGDVPSYALAEAIQQFQADVLAISASLPTHVPTVEEVIATVRQIPDPAVKVMVGGLAFAHTPDLWRKLGADGHAPTAGAAVDVAERLVGLE